MKYDAGFVETIAFIYAAASVSDFKRRTVLIEN